MTKLKTSFAALLTVGLMTVALAAPAAAQAPTNNQSGGAAGVVAAVVQVQDTLNDLQALNDLIDIGVINVEDVNVEVITVKNSLNNVLQNARFLNNINIIRDSQVLTNFLNNADIDVNVEDVVAVEVLSDNTVVLFTQ
jgi:hypothetical protein